MLDKYDEVAREVLRLYEQKEPLENIYDDVIDVLRSAFPPPAEDATSLMRSWANKGWLSSYHADEDECVRLAAEIESFAQSRVEPWREALSWVTHLLCGQGKRGGAPESGEIEEATAQARALLSDSPREGGK